MMIGTTGFCERGRSFEMIKITTFLAASLAVAGAAVAAPSPSATPAGTFKDWSFYTAGEGGSQVCFIASQPTDSKYSKTVSGRDPAFFQITTIPAKNIREEASSIVGYTFAADAQVVADVDGTKFKMFLDASYPDTTWAQPDQEAALVTAMRHGHTLTLSGSSSRKTAVTDTYSLSGIGAALDAMAKACK
jgi:invasion protein IalB